LTAPERGWGRLRVLVVDDEDDVCRGLSLLIGSLDAEVRTAESGEQALEVLAGWTPHVLLTDVAMKGVSGMDLLAHVRERLPEIKVLMISGFGTIELAVEAMRRGAAHFLTKPFDNQEVLAEIERHGREALIAERVRRMRATPGQGPTTLVAEDPRMARVLDLVHRVAPTAMPVLIRGESGTGKERIARILHENSGDPSLPFLAVNSAALPDTLLESELFGHVKGAFTGADASREGIFAQARGGTVFLDEIALMSPAFQGKLLRVLEDHVVVPLGSATPRSVAFRLVTASNRSLREQVAAGEFRQDLYYRLKVVTIDLPPLRKRPDDVVPLALHFLAHYAERAGLPPGHRPALTAEALDALQHHRWPGNVRELENSIQRALILSRGDDIGARHLGLDQESAVWSREASVDLTYEEGKQQVLETYQRRAVERALRASGGNITQAAEMCNLSRAAFQRLMRQLDLDRRQFGGGGGA
jgi:DNA-binding NtrC family response regulator